MTYTEIETKAITVFVTPNLQPLAMVRVASGWWYLYRCTVCGVEFITLTDEPVCNGCKGA